MLDATDVRWNVSACLNDDVQVRTNIGADNMQHSGIGFKLCRAQIYTICPKVGTAKTYNPMDCMIVKWIV